MKKVYFIMALLLSALWVIGFFMLGAGRIIHSVLMMGTLFYLQGIICGDGFKTQQSGEKVGIMTTTK